MSEIDAPPLAAPARIRPMLDVLRFIVFFFPPFLVSKLFPHGRWAWFFASFIAGALLVAILPPRTSRSVSGGLVIAAAMLILVFIAHFAGWK